MAKSRFRKIQEIQRWFERAIMQDQELFSVIPQVSIRLCTTESFFVTAKIRSASFSGSESSLTEAAVTDNTIQKTDAHRADPEDEVIWGLNHVSFEQQRLAA